MEKEINCQFDMLFRGCLSNERPADLLLLWRRRVESMMEKEDIFFLGIYTATAYMSYPMNLINDFRFLKIFCNLPLEKKITKQPYNKNNFSLYQKVHSFEIFHIFDMYTFLMGMPPLQDEERYSILQSFTTEEKRYLMNNLYPDFSETDFAVEGSFQFKAFEAFLATDKNFEDPHVIYSEYEKFKYLCLNCRNFTSRSLVSSILVVAALFNFGFVLAFLGVIGNVLFLQFGLFIDKFLFSWLYSRTVGRESVESCRRIWKRLHTFMTPLPSGKYVGSLALCVEEIKGKKHIEFKFCEDKYDQNLGQYFLSESQVTDKILLSQYPNTGIFFWFSIFSNVKITRRRIKINSYLSVEKFTPEFFLIDFQYFEPYPNNQLSRILCLPALFELVKITLESHFPGSKLSVISNGFHIEAPNTHTRVKISAVARYCLDKLKIGNSCNKTNRYVQLKEIIYKDLTNRIMVCKKDLESPMEFSAIVAIDVTKQLTYSRKTETVEQVTEVRFNPMFESSIDFPSNIWTLLGMKDKRPTFGWIAPALDFENRTLNLEFFEMKHRGFLKKRLVPIIESKFDYYSAGLDEPMQRETKIVKETTVVRHLSNQKVKEDFPNLAKPGLVHREIKIVPVCDMIEKISAKKKRKGKGESNLNFETIEKEIANRKKEKLNRLKGRSQAVNKAREHNINRISSELVSRRKTTRRDAEYVSSIVNKLVEKRVKSSGILYKRVDKTEFNSLVRAAKERFRKGKKSSDREFVLSHKLSKMCKQLKEKAREDSTLKQLREVAEYIYPYITHNSGRKLRAGNEFKLFLLKRRLTDYGISWKRTDDVLRDFNIVKNRPNLNRFEIPNRMRNLMRNMIQIVPQHI
jgi:hypothetical protein